MIRPFKQYTWRPLYLYIVERTLAQIIGDGTLDIDNHIEKLAKVRDDLVESIYKVMLFLASVLIMIFFVRFKIIEVPSLLSIKFSTFGEVYFIFTFFLVGNLVALLYASAMLKIFMVEAIIGFFVDIQLHKGRRYIYDMVSRFFTFIYQFVSRQEEKTIPKHVRNISYYLHIFMITAIPLTYMVFYAFVLISCLIFIWNGGGAISASASTLGTDSAMMLTDFQRKLLCGTLFVANLITLPIYLFTFLPLPVKQLPAEEVRAATEQRAYFIWKDAGCPSGEDRAHWHLAELQVRLLGLNT